MTIEKMLFSPSVLISFMIVLLVSIVLAFFPLIGTLGFEFSVLSAVILSFLSVFISASLISSALNIDGSVKRFSDLTGSILIINFLILLIPFLVGLVSSLIKDDCYIKEGAIFFLLIPTITVFLSTNIGMLAGYFFGRKGIFIGLLIILGILCYSLLKLYYGFSIFVYNPIFGLFPGPLYDEVIPISLTLIISRIIVFFWGIFFLLILRIASRLRYSMIGIWDTILLIMVVVVLITAHLNESEIGISYSREYITQNILSDSIETENFIIYFAPGAPEAKDIELIASDHEWRYRQLKEILQVDSAEKIRSYIYPDVETRKKLVGAGETTIANPIHKEIHLIYDSFPHPILKHELVHVMSAEFGNDILKLSPKIGLLEGIAVAADWRGQKFTPHQWAKVINEMGIAPRIQDIVGFGFWYAPSQVSYTLMGSFSRYLIDTYGIQDFKNTYKTGDFSVYGKSLYELGQQWQNYLKTIETPAETEDIAEAIFNEPSIFQATCPRRIAELKKEGYQQFNDSNYYRARDYFSDALEFNNADPALINWLAYSLYYEGNYDRAIEIGNSSTEGSKLDKHLLDNIKGNSVWQSGNSHQADQIFKHLLDNHVTDDLKRELEIKISAISEGSEIEENIKLFFGTRDRVLQVSYLEEAIKAYPFYAPPHYLLGRLLFNKGEYKNAVPHLIRAYLLGLSEERLTNENLRILGISLFAKGNYDQAINTFEHLLLNEKNEASKQYTRDFIERSQWMKENIDRNENELK